MHRSVCSCGCKGLTKKALKRHVQIRLLLRMQRRSARIRRKHLLGIGDLGRNYDLVCRVVPLRLPLHRHRPSAHSGPADVERQSMSGGITTCSIEWCRSSFCHCIAIVLLHTADLQMWSGARGNFRIDQDFVLRAAESALHRHRPSADSRSAVEGN